jgi:hypothetical protein
MKEKIEELERVQKEQAVELEKKQQAFDTLRENHRALQREKS